MVLSYVTCLIHFSVFLRKRGNASTDQFFASMVPLNEPSNIFLVRCSPKTNYSLKDQYVGVSQVLQGKPLLQKGTYISKATIGLMHSKSMNNQLSLECSYAILRGRSSRELEDLVSYNSG